MSLPIISIAAGITWLALFSRVLVVAARIFQIEEYEAHRVVAWAWQRPWLANPATVLAAALPAAGAVLGALASEGRVLTAAGWLAGAALAHLLWRWLPAKKPLVTTPRMRRLLGTTMWLAGLCTAAAVLLLLMAPLWLAALLVVLLGPATPALTVTLLALGNRTMAPVEARIRRTFLQRARQKLERLQPLVIAVAGSYGKTSTKHILAHLLRQYGETLPTPKSFNTLMGVCRTINDDLQERHRTFVVEMDAYAPGEIAAICELVSPRHAVITSVGPQHLERFGSMDRIADALYEAVQALPHDGTAVICADEAWSATLAARARREAHPTVAYGAASADLDVVADSVRVDGDGSSFVWIWPAENLRQELRIPLLGRHQVLNVSAALALVHRLGLRLAPALHAVSTLQPVEHRLQPVPTGNAVTVIDDSYNANPVGVHNGLEVLDELGSGARILVTPGLVELGAVEDEENRRYGEHAARVCDHVVVMEARPCRALREGLRSGGLAADRIHVVRSLDDATAVIARVARAGDVVLFANDLPDTYLGRS